MSEHILYPVAVQFHILRHFESIDKSYRSLLKNNSPYTDEEIHGQLGLSGSKFYREFARNPQELLETIIEQKKNKSYLRIITQEERVIWIVRFPEKKYEKGIGNNGLIKIDSLSEEEKKGLYTGEREGKKVNLIRLNRRNPTWQLCVIISRDESPSILTVFPGDYAPALPDPEEMNGEEFEKSIAFWEKYALVVKNPDIN